MMHRNKIPLPLMFPVERLLIISIWSKGSTMDITLTQKECLFVLMDPFAE